VQNGVGLGHRRLSIIDLGTGKQPMFNEDESVVVVFNGEIYNYESLRDTLKSKGHLFKTRSDTEVIVHAYEEYGEEFLEKLRGMFAIALWDDKNRILLLARDRVGIKPLYFSASPNWVVFASEIKAILQDAELGDVEVNPRAVDSFLRFYFIPGRDTIFQKVKRLLPGCYLKVCNGQMQEHRYWDLEYGTKYHDVRFEDLKSHLDSLLRETVRGHMLSDVPVGFLLSGGVDSTALLSYAVNETKKEVSSFTVGFSGQDFADEREYAGIVARKFRTKHHDITISAADFLNFLPGYVWHMEEPVCEPPAIALYYISKLASGYVKVLISGEGGDEAFAGYPNYANNQIVNKIRKLIGPLNRPIAKILKYLFINKGSNRYAKYGYVLGGDLSSYYYSRTSGPHTLFNDGYPSMYTGDMMNVHGNNSIFEEFINDLHNKSNGLNYLDRMLYVDLKTWLPDDLLIKADKMTMANSVELRVPFLDHEVMEFAANIPSKYKIKGTNTKFILKETFRGVVPDEILFRKKTGFPIPYDKWLRKEMMEYVRDILLDKKSIERGYFNKNGLEAVLTNNITTGSYSKEIFSLLILEIWHRIFIDKVKL